MSALPSRTWQMLASRGTSSELPTGVDAVWDAAIGRGRQFFTHPGHYLRAAKRIIAREKEYVDLTDAKLRECAIELREIFRLGRDKPRHVEVAYAIVREVASRLRNERHYPVQIAGALALHVGSIVEMATGEGKTLVATMPATLAGWRGLGCHVVTANDYLAQRDAESMQPIYEFLGLRVGYVTQDMEPGERHQAYRADITYLTNKEAAADFLRDRLAMGSLHGVSRALLDKIAGGSTRGVDRLVQRGLRCAIVDEADSLLIDEAVTPLIISGEAPNPEQVETFQQASQMAEQLQSKTHFRVNEQYREVELTSSGKRQLEELSKQMGSIWAGARRREELVTQALTAQTFYECGKQYVVQEDKIVIVDEFTGRLMPDREWRDGLHQAVEAKEGLEVNPPKDTYARVSFQRFFRLYGKLSGMTGTAAEAKREFWQIYHRPVVRIPTNRPCIRKYLPSRIYSKAEHKWRAIVEEIKVVHATHRPILVGTRSVEASETLGALLEAEGLMCQILNAVRHAEEAQIVAESGQPDHITVATNMAGRGTDIKLGRGMSEVGGLHVILTEYHEAGRIDRQLQGRCSRQGDPGSVRCFASMDDELLLRHAPRRSALCRARFGNASRNIASPLTRRLFRRAQLHAERTSLQQRKGVLKTDNWLDEYLGFAGKEV